ncbi:MAG: hypothetical protein Q3M30_05955 [Candidatus Electrothrix sp. Rat3]|nr:hypothetical protein [Candidatus Electrothrix rattekaaiensis]
MRSNRYLTKGENSPNIVNGNYNNTEIYINNKSNIEWFTAFRRLSNKIKSLKGKYFDTITADLTVLPDKCFHDELTIGQRITVEGFLSKYILTHREKFHTPFTRKAGKTIVENNHVKMEVGGIPTPLPIQSFPPFLNIDGKKYVYFLYPFDFSNFLVCPGPKDDIEQEAKPLLLISPDDLSQFTEKNIRLTGVLSEFEDGILNPQNNVFTRVQQNIFGNIMRPYNESIKSLCISIFDRSKSSIEVIGEKESLNALIYVESHFENTRLIHHRLVDNNKDSPFYETFIGDMLPGSYPGMHWFGNLPVDKKSSSAEDVSIPSGLCDSDVFLKTTNFREFAYFIETDIVNHSVNKNKLFKMKEFVDEFRRNVRRFYKKHTGVEIINVYDFLYDFNKSKFFHPKGIMSSAATHGKPVGDEERKTITWLKNS